MKLFPAIDLKNGQVVRLVKGEFSTAHPVAGDAVETARAFKAAGAQWVHMVDLDGALAGRSVNEEAIRSILSSVSVPVQIGGGIRLFPKAKPDDGYMDFIIVDYLSRFKTFVAFAKLFFGKLGSIKEVTSARCRQAVIYPCSDSFTIQAEGELYDYSNCDSVAAEIVAGKLRFYLPHSD